MNLERIYGSHRDFSGLSVRCDSTWLLPKILRGVDIRTLGDGNPGTTNVKRESGGLSIVLCKLHFCQYS
ncbi:glycerol-3-phosphate acyltransferase [Athalassotoga saccharophila]|uniref:glycerol-3-phosphate acyltransferase n=1 Tax=Athalassotoga saccharophila TaxID=1441386 RepID=UPI0038CC1256